MAALPQDAGQFVVDVSNATGIDPRVLTAWIVHEGAYTSNGTGGFNYLNLRTNSRDKYQSVSSSGFEKFANLSDAEVATVRRLNDPFARPILSTAGTKPNPQEQIKAIAATNWDANHYGGAGGPNLLSTFDNLFGRNAETTQYVPPSAAGGVVSSTGAGSAADLASNFGSGLVTTPVNAVKDVYNAALALPKFLAFVTSIRFLEILGGGIMILAALILIAKEVGVNAPVKAPFAR